MPIEDLPTIGISAARNGGYTRFVLPGSGSSGQEGFVIYFPDEPPAAATNPAVVSIDVDGEEIYETTTFQEVNALSLTAPLDDSAALFGQYLDLSSLNINGPFTVEWFFRIASSVPIDLTDGAYSIVSVVATDDYIENEEGSGFPVPFTGNEVSVTFISDNVNEVQFVSNLVVADGYNGVAGEYSSTTQPGNTAATQFKHASIQHLGQGSFVVHYNGSKISELNTTLQSLGVVAFVCSILKVDGAGISQIRVSTSAIYGDADTITVPTTAFYTPPES